jgi:hypothetical protein
MASWMACFHCSHTPCQDPPPLAPCWQVAHESMRQLDIGRDGMFQCPGKERSNYWCTYGDRTSLMGGGTQTFSLHHRDAEGWLAPTAVARLDYAGLSSPRTFVLTNTFTAGKDELLGIRYTRQDPTLDSPENGILTERRPELTLEYAGDRVVIRAIGMPAEDSYRIAGLVDQANSAGAPGTDGFVWVGSNVTKDRIRVTVTQLNATHASITMARA